jgi:hypothetical protein
MESLRYQQESIALVRTLQGFREKVPCVRSIFSPALTRGSQLPDWIKSRKSVTVEAVASARADNSRGQFQFYLLADGLVLLRIASAPMALLNALTSGSASGPGPTECICIAMNDLLIRQDMLDASKIVIVNRRDSVGINFSLEGSNGLRMLLERVATAQAAESVRQ